MKTIFKNFAVASSAIIATLAVCLGILAWSEPGATPPEGNIAAPINTGADLQTKTGDLKIGNGLKISYDGQSFALKKDNGTKNFIVGQDGNIIVNGKISNLTNPVDGQDAATKAYVDAQVGGDGGCDGQMLHIKFTATAYDGNLGGINGANAKCNAEFPGYHMCSWEELGAAGRTGCMPPPGQYFDILWSFVDRSGVSNNCNRWTSNAVCYNNSACQPSLLFINNTSGRWVDYQSESLLCNRTYNIACCSN